MFPQNVRLGSRLNISPTGHQSSGSREHAAHEPHALPRSPVSAGSLFLLGTAARRIRTFNKNTHFPMLSFRRNFKIKVVFFFFIFTCCAGGGILQRQRGGGGRLLVSRFLKVVVRLHSALCSHAVKPATLCLPTK